MPAPVRASAPPPASARAPALMSAPASARAPARAHAPTPARASASVPVSAPVSAQEPTENDLLAEKVLLDVPEYHRTHRPKNTTKNYAPKQKEWQVFLFLSLLPIFNIVIIFLGMVQEDGIWQASPW